MKVSYHAFSTSDFGGGALYYYTEISRLLDRSSTIGIKSVPHDLFWLAGLNEHAAIAQLAHLGPEDVLVSNVGPYAHLYHYLREKGNGRFRIIRDLRTTSWAGFLLQEHLCARMIRPGDMALFPSEFARKYFCRLFPTSLDDGNTAVCYPLTAGLPTTPARPTYSGPLRLGYIGRISEDKNFIQVLRILASATKLIDARIKLILAGSFDHAGRFRSLSGIKKHMRRLGAPVAQIDYLGVLRHREISRFYSNIDVLLFPSMANVESLGRVLVEAAHAKVDVISANYAAAAELFGEENCSVANYSVGRPFKLNSVFSFGSVDEIDAVKRLARLRVPRDCSRFPQYQPEAFYDLVAGGPPLPVQNNDIGVVGAAFLQSLVVSGIDPLNESDAMERCAMAYHYFRRYHAEDPWRRITLLPRVLQQRASPMIYLNRLLTSKRRSWLGHARVFCSLLGFNPILELRPLSPSAMRLLGNRTSLASGKRCEI